MRIELPIETERLFIRPLVVDDAEDLGESEEWIREKVDRFERDGLGIAEGKHIKIRGERADEIGRGLLPAVPLGPGASTCMAARTGPASRSSGSVMIVPRVDSCSP